MQSNVVMPKSGSLYPAGADYNTQVLSLYNTALFHIQNLEQVTNTNAQQLRGEADYWFRNMLTCSKWYQQRVTDGTASNVDQNLQNFAQTLSTLTLQKPFTWVRCLLATKHICTQ